MCRGPRVYGLRGPRSSRHAHATAPCGEAYMNLDVFISHSSRDEDIARALMELLHNACNIPLRQIRCTSVDGSRLEVGVTVDEQVRAEVNAARLFIGLITPDSVLSPYVLFEIGARWGAGKKLAPLLAAGAGRDFLKLPLSVLNALDCSSEGQMHQLVNDVANFLQYPRAGPELYEHYLRKLVSLSREKGTKPNPY